MFPWTEGKAELLRDFSCSYGSAARRKASYPAGKIVSLRKWNNGSFDLLDGPFQIKRGAEKDVDFKELSP
jgi:hypothetical protein